jgi:hypothetical protein
VKKLSYLSVIAFASAIAALSACSGSNPSNGSAAGFAPGAPMQVAAPQSVDLCAKLPPKGYAFHGECWQGTLKKAGAAASLTVYQNTEIAMQLGSNNAPGSTISLRDATGKKDITGAVKGKTFPLYVGFGEPVIYFDFHNASAKAVAFAKTPQIAVTVTNGPFNPTATCGLSFLQTGQWVTVPALTGKIAGSVLTYAPDTIRKEKVTIPALGDLYAVAWCNGY